jgi:hypothetical protein
MKPSPVRIIDVFEKERLTLIEYTGFRKENLATKARRASLSPDEKARLITLILRTLSTKKPPMSPPPPPSRPGPKDPKDRKPEDPDQGGAGFALAVPTIPNNFHVT